MRSLIIVGLTVLSVGGGACSMSEHFARERHTYGSAADSVFFSVERTPCFGKCPTYSTRVDRNGGVEWVGRQNVERMGTWNAHMDYAQMELLLDRAKAIGFFAMQDRYDGEVTDLPSTILRVNADGTDKQVMGRYRTPPGFKSLATYADSLLGTLEWKALAGADH